MRDNFHVLKRDRSAMRERFHVLKKQEVKRGNKRMGNKELGSSGRGSAWGQGAEERDARFSLLLFVPPQMYCFFRLCAKV
jgi:hypothetical protein